jgi:hypothetical protein
MNDDDLWYNAFNREMTYGKGWTNSTTSEIYNLLKHIEIQSKGTKMPYYNDRYRTRGDEVATALLEAYADGVAFETVIQKNSTVRQYWQQIQSEKVDKIKKAEQEKIRRQKAAEKKKLEDAARAEVVAKLTPEELAAFGLNKKGYHR